MNHKQFKEVMKKTETGFFHNSMWIVLFFWVSFLAAFLAQSWLIVGLIFGIVTIKVIFDALQITRIYEKYMFFSYSLDELYKNKKGKK